MFVMLRKAKLLTLGLVAFVLAACATSRQAGLIETYDRLTFTYDTVARTLARTCVFHDVPQEKCDAWGREVNRARQLLLDMGRILDTVVQLSIDPALDPECQKLLDACPPDDLDCRTRARDACLRKYYNRYWRLQQQVSNTLRRLYYELKKQP